MKKKSLLFRLFAVVAAMMCTLGIHAQEAYACYTSDNTTLTFYYDTQRSSRTGTTYNLNTGNNDTEWSGDGINANVTKVVFDPSFAAARPTTTFNWFYGMRNLQYITGMAYLNTADVTDMSAMFYNCPGLTSLDLSSLNTANVTVMTGMFQSCSGLTSLNLSGFNTANVTEMERMFSGCSSLTTLNLGSFNTAKVMRMQWMFYNCSELTTIYVGDGWSTAAVNTSSSMFSKCTSLVGGMGTTYSDSNPKDKTYAHIDGGPDNPGYFTAAPEAYVVVTTNTWGDATLKFYYDNQRASRPGKIYDLNAVNEVPGWYTDGTYSRVVDAVIDPSFADARPRTTYGWFAGMENLDYISGLIYLNTSNVIDMRGMFFYCTSLKGLNLSLFNTDKVVSMTQMFYECNSLTSLDVSGFNTSNVIDMSSMFQSCIGLTSLDVSGFNTDKVMSMYAMFTDCANLTSLDVSGFNTSNVTDMLGMFGNCTGLTSLDVSHFNTDNVTDMYYMFGGCTGLTSLDLSSFNTSKVTDMGYMFLGCSNLQTIYAGDGWSTAAVTNSSKMFDGCTSLVGGMGTTYDEDHTNASYAHIDGGPGNPGYFTDINAPAGPEAYAVYTEDNTTLTFYYDDQRRTRPSTTTYGLNTGTEDMEWHNTPYYFRHVVFDPSFADAHPTTTYRWFYEMSNLLSITGMEYLNTDSVTNMASMFERCSKLPSLDLSHFNTANVTTMQYMFRSCMGLTNLDLSSFNTDNVTTMDCMMSYCTGLTSVDLSSFTNARVTRTSNMFEGCSALTTIYASSSWSLPANNYSWGMFIDCTSLVGGMGTTFDENHIDAEYAHIDGGPSNPGYFTEKPAFKLGDVNGDGVVDIDDVTMQINVVLGNSVTGFISANADLNGDERIDIDDVTLIINMVLGN